MLSIRYDRGMRFALVLAMIASAAVDAVFAVSPGFSGRYTCRSSDGATMTLTVRVEGAAVTIVASNAIDTEDSINLQCDQIGQRETGSDAATTLCTASAITWTDAAPDQMQQPRMTHSLKQVAPDVLVLEHRALAQLENAEESMDVSARCDRQTAR